jgi:hypothetical protein
VIARFRDVSAWQWSILVAVAACFIWALSLGNTDINGMTDIGLLSVLPVTHYLALCIMLVTLCVLIHRNEAPEGVYFVYTLIVILMIHTLPPILYGIPRYSWAWKHLGIVDYIISHHTVNPEIHVQNVYHNWPGFFALTALILEVSGLNSPISFALWAEVVANVLNLLGLILILRSLSDDRRLIWLSALFFSLTNWIGQDYYSPQAIAYFLYLIIIGICLRWFRTTWTVVLPEQSRWPLLQRGLRGINWLLDRAHQTTLSAEATNPLTRFSLMLIVILASVVIIASHQLTPVMLILSTFFLTQFRQSNTKQLPNLIIIIFLGWSLFVAHRYIGKEVWPLIDSLMEISGNVSGGFVNLSDLSPGQQIVAIGGRIFTVFIWTVALAGVIRRIRSHSMDMTAMLLVLGPLVMPIINPYGGEILFRVYLFTLPVIAFLCAAVIFPSRSHGKALGWIGVASMLSIIFAASLYLVYFGKDRQYRFTQNEVDGVRYLYSVAPENSLLVQGSWNYPTQFLNYDHFVYVPITLEDDEVHERIQTDPEEVMARWLSDEDYTASYILITRSMKIQTNTLGELPFNMLDNLEKALLASDKFTLFYENEDVRIFILLQDSGKAGP